MRTSANVPGSLTSGGVERNWETQHEKKTVKIIQTAKSDESSSHLPFQSVDEGISYLYQVLKKE